MGEEVQFSEKTRSSNLGLLVDSFQIQIPTFSEAFPLRLEVKDGRLAVRVRVVRAPSPLDEVIERVLIGVLLAPHEHHVLEEVRQTGHVGGVGKAPGAHAQPRGRLFEAGRGRCGGGRHPPS